MFENFEVRVLNSLFLKESRTCNGTSNNSYEFRSTNTVALACNSIDIGYKI